MKSTRDRLDRYLSRQLNISKREVRQLLLNKKVLVNHVVATDMNLLVHQFAHVKVNDTVVQSLAPIYIMLNKPKGVVSATKDRHHRTVIDLLPSPQHPSLHIAGRLDFNTTGLLLLTNDGSWSRRLSLPQNNIIKKYRVVLEKPVTSDYVDMFEKGIYFAYENITTRPAYLNIISPQVVELNIAEGRYHQVKRMFGYFNNKVLDLHRVSVGGLTLDANLALGESRHLLQEELSLIFSVDD